VREQPPLLAAAFEDVENSIQDLTKAVGPWPSMTFGSWHVRFDVVPFDIREIRRVRFSHAC
jgi:hypothetical protein